MRKPIPYGRFLLLDRIAVGGMAEVWVAVRRDDPAARPYAVKRILPTLAEDEAFITMFLDEARLVVQLDHPGILPVHELGKQGDGYYIAMDYVAGRDLRALIDRTRARGERVPIALAAFVGWRIADALHHAHTKRDARGEELRVVHRDVSPANVLLGFDGSVRVIDFGIAQAAIRTRRQDTVLRGKFGYMTPEMVGGGPVDRRSDVFALGVVLHELLTGERLFTARSELAVLEKIRSADVRPPSASNPAVPPALDALVMRALAREPEARFPWASELRDALVAWTHAGGTTGDPPALARCMARTFPAELRAELDRMERLRALPPPPPAQPPPGEAERTQVIALRLDDGPVATPPAAAAPPSPHPSPPALRGAREEEGGAATSTATRASTAVATGLPAGDPVTHPSPPALRGAREEEGGAATSTATRASTAVATGLTAGDPVTYPSPPRSGGEGQTSSPAAASKLRGTLGFALAAALVLAAAAISAAAWPGASPAAHADSGLIVVQPRSAATLVLDGAAISPPLAAGEVRATEVVPGEHRIELRTEDGRRAGATVDVRAGETTELLGVELE